MDLISCFWNNIPNEIIVNGDFNASNLNRKDIIAKKIVVKGNFNIDNAKFNKIAEEIEIEGDISGLNLEKLKELPDNLHVKGDLSLTGIQMQKLPENMIIEKSFLISSQSLQKLPDILTVGDVLNIKNCKNINFIPNTINCKTLYINKKQIKLISEALDFEFIKISKNNGKIYTKQEFFSNFINPQKNYVFSIV